MSSWWLKKPMRMVQTNLREIDAGLDVDKYIESIREFCADVVLFNVGGIVANYPSKLPYHYVNPNLKDDLVGKVLSRLKEEGIRFIARFDFSKVNEVFAEKNPEWLYRSKCGQFIYYNHQVHTCINGKYQQEYALNILEEVIRNYPIDGVFFNMIGYVTRDYSGNYHGICQCENCRQRFKAYSGKDLPLEEDSADPVYRIYENFKNDTSSELFHRITEHVKKLNKDIAICTYTHEGVDIFRKESNTALNRPLPEWNYSASENVKTVHGSWDNMAVSNAAVHFVDYPFRHSAVSPHLNNIRLVQDMANGGWLDYYVIGNLYEQDDRVGLEDAKEIFRFHKQNERYFTGTSSLADCCLVVPSNSTYYGSMKEFKGIFRILAQNHILFDCMHDSVLEKPEALSRLKKYKLLILPDARNMSDACTAAIDKFVEEGGKILITGKTSMCDSNGNFTGAVRLKSAGIAFAKEVIPKEDGCYFRIRKEDKAKLLGFDNLDIVYMHSDYVECVPQDGTETYLGFIPAAMFGPPEKCYYTTETDKPGVFLSKYGKGKCVFIPWEIGRLYERLSNHGHEMLLMGCVNDLLGFENMIKTDASPLVEFIVHAEKQGKWNVINLINLSGQLGTAFLEPLPVNNINIEFRTDKEPKKVYGLKNSTRIGFRYENGKVKFKLPYLGLFETIILEN